MRKLIYNSSLLIYKFNIIAPKLPKNLRDTWGTLKNNFFFCSLSGKKKVAKRTRKDPKKIWKQSKYVSLYFQILKGTIKL